jgi:hypothetical protein
MDRARLVFALVFLLLPLLAILLALAVAGLGTELALTLGAVALLVTGFTVALGFVDA